jgi:hypothetical protein
MTDAPHLAGRTGRLPGDPVAERCWRQALARAEAVGLRNEERDAVALRAVVTGRSVDDIASVLGVVDEEKVALDERMQAVRADRAKVERDRERIAAFAAAQGLQP